MRARNPPRVTHNNPETEGPAMESAGTRLVTFLFRHASLIALVLVTVLTLAGAVVAWDHNCPVTSAFLLVVAVAAVAGMAGD